MFDAKLRPLIGPPLNAIGRRMAALGISANAVTLVGLALGLGAAVAIAWSNFLLGLALILANRLADGIDGAIARVSGKSDLGGYLDIVSDFAFYVAIPVGFGFASPANMPAALLLVASFTITGISFLGYAAIAAQRGDTTDAHGQKSFFYSTGIAEGSETIIAFVLMALFPPYFPLIAPIYAALCIVTVIQRTILAACDFR